MGTEIPQNKYCENTGFGKMEVFLGSFLGCMWPLHFGKTDTFLGEYYAGRPGVNLEVMAMRKRNYKGQYEKRIVEKSKEVCRTYDEMQKVYLDRLQPKLNMRVLIKSGSGKTPIIQALEKLLDLVL